MIANASGRKSPGVRAGRLASILALAMFSATCFQSTRAGEAHKHHGGASGEQPVSRTAVEDFSVPRGIELLNQEGERVHVYRDLVERKVVAINTIFTTCVTICPIMGVYFAQLQRHESLSGRMGRDLNLISISIDPGTDTPDRLKAWSKKLGGLPGWTLLTGNKAEVEKLLEGLRIPFPGDDKTKHSQLVLVGNDTTKKWTYIKGDASPNVLADAIGAALELR